MDTLSRNLCIRSTGKVSPASVQAASMSDDGSHRCAGAAGQRRNEGTLSLVNLVREPAVPLVVRANPFPRTTLKRQMQDRYEPFCAAAAMAAKLIL